MGGERRCTSASALTAVAVARAEFANYKKRVEREQAGARDRIAGETLTMYLGVLDDLERALKERPEDGDAAAWADGIELIYKKMFGVDYKEGSSPVKCPP